ncbi:MerR family transcriptional regulator [Salinicoccus sp. HZC-1]|uniref:MerR family transcriptional regulator n=1 Tax=Salinicoccus sp. HZC-1 TaxID=3385497 RepID=UPI00398BB844
MRETNHAVYYTTAQVKDMVELSDQNVRKYVRLLEDRKYEVAKDEHNRRLFSQEDIAVLKEFIKLAKQPGYTLETAADEIIEKVPHIISEKSGNTPANITNNDIDKMLGAVMDKLEVMQQENRELKHNVHSLVERLEAYSKYNEPLSLEYRDNNANTETAEWESDKINDSNNNEDTSEFEEPPREESSQNELAEEKAPADEEVTADEKTSVEDSNTSNIDMSNYGNDENNNDNSLTPDENTAEQSLKKEEEKGGYFSKLFGIFKK